MYIPKRENMRYQLRTKSGRLILVAHHIEEIEPYKTANRVVWFWYNGRYIAK